MGYKRLILSILITACFLALISNIFMLTKPIKLSFEAEGSQIVTFRIYYTTNKLETYNEERSVAKTVDLRQTSRVALKIPAWKIYHLRIDFDPTPVKLSISNITLTGRKKIHLDRFLSNIEFNDIDKHHLTDNKLTVSSNKIDPFISFKNIIRAKAAKKLDIHLFIIAASLSFLFFYKIVNYLGKFKIIENNSRIDIVFISVFFILLFIPMSRIDYSEISVQENRTLAKYTPLFNQGILNSKFGSNFEDWYNDRFRGRHFLTNVYNFILHKINNKMENEKAFRGKDNWLFYKLDNGIKNYQNAILFSQWELNTITNYLNGFQKWCKKRNKKFYVVIGPDKNKIYGEYFYDLKKLRPDSESKTQQLIGHLQKNSEINIIYPYDIIMKNKKNGLLYWKNDTHWNRYGAYYGYLDIIKHIKHDFPQIPQAQITGFAEEKHLKGDITQMFTSSQQFEDNTIYKIPVVKDFSSCKENGSSKDITCTNKHAKLKLLMFRDSFTSSMIPYIAQSFKNARFLWHYEISPEDFAAMEKADIIIYEIVERGTYFMTIFKFPEE